MVWGGIYLSSRTALVVVSGGNLTADRYPTNILTQHDALCAPYRRRFRLNSRLGRILELKHIIMIIMNITIMN